MNVKRRAGRTPPTATRDVVILVMGMARSGSSATARVLSLCGGHLPGKLLPANQANPAGYWEPDTAVRANARFLRDRGSSFFDTRLAQDCAVEAPRGVEYVAKIATFLRGCRDGGVGAPLVIKDPRISVLSSFWLAAAELAGFAPCVVIPVRHPIEVAASLSRWKGLAMPHVAELWLKYNLLAERHTRHVPRVFVSFSRLLADWRTEVRSISETLNLALTLNDRVDGFLDSRLRHEVSDPGSAWPDVRCLRDVHRILAAACEGQEVDFGALDAAFLDLSEAQATGAMPVVHSFGADFGITEG